MSDRTFSWRRQPGGYRVTVSENVGLGLDTMYRQAMQNVYGGTLFQVSHHALIGQLGISTCPTCGRPWDRQHQSSLTSALGLGWAKAPYLQ